MTEKGDPQKEKVGTEGATPRGERDAAEDAAKVESEQAAAEEQAAAGARGPGATKEPADVEAGRPKRARRRKRAEPKQVPESRKSAEDEAREEDLEEGAREVQAEPAAEAAGVEADEKAPPRRRRRRKEEAEAAQPEVRAEDAEAEAAEGTEPETEVESEAPGEEKPARRRGAAETTAARPAPAPRREGDGAVVVRASARYVRCAPRKARLVVDHIRGKSVDEARAILQHTPRAAAQDVLKLLDSCVANAENNHELVADELKVHQAYVDEGPTLKRYRPRALGRATRINKRTSHMTITLTPKA